MSPLGRVFIVLNLVLAAAFVGFAGTFLQRHTDYKDRYDQKAGEFDRAKEVADAERKALNEQFSAADRELRQHKAQLDTTANENKGLREENQQLEQRLTDLTTDVKNLSSQTTTMAEEIRQATVQGKQAYELAMQASQAKDEALGQKEAAEAALAEANRKVSALEGSLAEQNGRIAGFERDTAEKDVLLAMVNRRFPGLLAVMQPDIKGVVQTVQGGEGELLTIRVTDNAGQVEVKPGYTFAIYKDAYKGEAVIQDVQGEFAFCRVTTKVDGATVQVGDAAATNVGM